jgi:hypothetical protein
MKTTLSERKELLIKEIISLIKNFDYSKIHNSRWKGIHFVEIDYNLSERDTFKIKLNDLFNIRYNYFEREYYLYCIECKEDFSFFMKENKYREERKYKIWYYTIEPYKSGEEHHSTTLTIRQFKKLFNKMCLLELFSIKLKIKKLGSK